MPMLCLDDCLDFCELERDEVDAIAEHEHVPSIVAAEIGSELLKSDVGVVKLHTMILEDIEIALAHGRTEHAQELAMTYRHFQSAHPIHAF
jgi:hypothetical protein